GAKAMSGKSYRRLSGWFARCVAGATLLTAGLSGALRAQSEPLFPPAAANQPALFSPAPAAEATGAAPADGGVVQTGCSSCGRRLCGGNVDSLGPGGGGCATCGTGCYPGRKPCDCCFPGNTCVGRFIGGLYECICCPDPCYEPRWLAVANNAFFVDAAR